MLGLLVGLGIGWGFVAEDEPGAAAYSTPASGSPLTPAPRLALASEPRAERWEPAEAAAAGADRDMALGLGRGVSPSPTRARLAAPAPALRQPPPEAVPASSRIVLEPLAIAPGAVTAGITGYDTGAPRELELWRVRAGRAVRLGRAESDANARIHGPQLPLPAEGIELVATPRGVAPGGPGASEPLHLAREAESGSRAPSPEDPHASNLPRWRHPSAARTSTHTSSGEEIR